MKRRNSRKWIWIFLTVCWVLSLATIFLLGKACCQSQVGNGISAHGALRVDGTKLRDESGEVVVLQGFSSHGLGWYPRYLNGAAMDTLSQAGANVMRLAMYTEANNGYLESPEENLNYLYMGIETVLAADLYVIVDWHILRDGNPNTYITEASAFFNEISTHYKDHPGIIYEICNEPNGDTTWEDVSDYANIIIPIIRENAPNSIILVGTPNYCTDFSGPKEDPLSFSNIMYSMHRYVDVSQYKPCDVYLINSVVQAQLPVFVSEWGVTGGSAVPASRSEDYPENAKPFLEYMQQHDISWTAWALSNNDESHSTFHKDSNKLSNWTESDLTSFGKLIFESLWPEQTDSFCLTNIESLARSLGLCRNNRRWCP